MLKRLPVDTPRGPSIVIQVMGLLIGGVLVAQTVTTVLLMILPPPRPPLYRLSEIAAALRGGSLRTTEGRRLVRLAQPTAPSADGQCAVDPDRETLAALLDASGKANHGLAEGAPAPQDLRLSHAQSSLVWPPWRSGRSPADCARETRWTPAESGRVVFGQFVAAWRQNPGAWVVVKPSVDAFPNDWQRLMMLWFAASLVIVLPTGYLFARRITAPLAAFARAADRFGRDPNAPHMMLAGPAEIGVAARAFNEMQGRLRRHLEDRTAMVGAISHDLRTPLARIRFRMEPAAPALRSAVIGDIEQMEAMIGAVLEFIRDSAAQRSRQPVDLLSVLECTVDDAATTGGAASLESEFQATVVGDPAALRRLFANLIDNAIKYGGCAKVSLEALGRDVIVDVADEGPGLPPEEIERVFEPFYRAQASRNLDDGGIGLGLAIARTIACDHGGDVRLICSPRGLTARVQLPLGAPWQASAGGRRDPS